MPTSLRTVVLLATLAASSCVSRAARAEPTPARVGAAALPVPHPGVLAQVERIAATLQTARYSHSTRVDAARGRYEFDCSGMVAWVLARVAPAAHRATRARAGGGRPLARDYYQQIAASPAERPARGWLRVARVSDAQPGDVIAWLRPREWRSPNTGHVVIVVAPPERVALMPNTYRVRVADASQYQHADDTRAGTGRDGFGMGTMIVVADEATGAPRAYGWNAHAPFWTRETSIAIGRPVR